MFKSAFAVFLASCAVHVALSQNAFAQNKVTPDKEASIKADLAGQIDGMKKQAQVMVDSVFSFGELGMQEFETSKYLSGILEKEGFRIQRGVAGIPTAWVAEWGSGKPVISLGSDIDDIPQASQKPGVGYHDPMIEGAPGHGEGHNSGVPLNIVAALAVKKIMEREHMHGTIEEQDRPAILEFLRRVLTEQADLGASPVFCVSARAAVRAQAAANGQALDRSGLTELENYLGNF